MKNLTKTIQLMLSTCFLVSLGVLPVLGQITDNDLPNLLDAVERNQELLEQARELVSETNSVKARVSLTTAAHLHEQSKSALQSVADAPSLRRAARLVLSAREAILQTIALAKRDVKLEEAANKAIEKATGRLEQASQLLSEQPSRDADPARRMVGEARSLLQRSRDNMREHLFEISLRLAVSSEEFSSRAIRHVRRDSFDVERLRRELEKTDRVIERLADKLNDIDDAAAQRVFRDAQDTQRKAKASFSNERFRVAADLTQRARNMAMRALRRVASSADQENVEQALRLTDMLLQEARELLADRDAPARLQQKIEQAAELQNGAKRQYEAGHFERALAMTMRAREILKDALSSIRQTLDKSEIHRTLVATDALLDELRESLAASDNETATELYVRALEKQAKAWEAFEAEKLRAALAHTKLARGLAQRAARLVRQ